MLVNSVLLALSSSRNKLVAASWLQVIGARLTQFLLGIGNSYDIMQEVFNTHPTDSENCLYIDKFAPASTFPRHGYAVVLFIARGG